MAKTDLRALAERAAALAESGRKYMRDLAQQGLSGLSFDKLTELAEQIRTAPSDDKKVTVSPALAAAVAAVQSWIERVQAAIRREFPGNPTIDEEFQVNQKPPSEPEKLLDYARAVGKAAERYATNLLNRGLDMAFIRNLSNLEKNLRAALEGAGVPMSREALVAQAKEIIGQVEQAARAAFKDVPTRLAELGFGAAPAADEGGEKKKKNRKHKEDAGGGGEPPPSA